MSTLLLISDDSGWVAEFKKNMPDLKIRKYPNIGDFAEIDYALVWEPKPGLLGELPNLKTIFSISRGVDHILKAPNLPMSVPIVRMSVPYQQKMVAEYAVLAVLYLYRAMPSILHNMKQKTWIEQPVFYTPDFRVGILGLGEIGKAIAHKLSLFDFQILGWSQTKKNINFVNSFQGKNGLKEMLPLCNYIICALPLTTKTKGLIDNSFLHCLPRGANIINLGRGAHIVETDLLEALESGQIGHAILDVFDYEPLSKQHPFWCHEKITVTPHMAGEILPKTATHSIIKGIKRSEAGEGLENIFDAELGY